jgi:hypothetical protein
MTSSTSAAPAIPDNNFLPSLQKYDFNKLMAWTLQREPVFGNYDIDLIRYILSRILLVKRLVKKYRWINWWGRSGVIRFRLKRLWRTGVRSRKVAAGIGHSMMTQKAKSWPGLRYKQKNPRQWHAPIFGTITKLSIPLRLPKDILTPLF